MWIYSSLRKISKFLYVAAVISLSAPVLANQQAPLSISLSAPQAVYRSGDTITIYGHFKNVSSANYEFIYGNMEDYNGISVTRTDGAKVKVRMAGRTVLDSVSGRSLEFGHTVQISHVEEKTLRPGDEAMDESVISNLYDMSTPGTYLVIVGRFQPKDDGSTPDGTWYYSNKLRLTVNP